VTGIQQPEDLLASEVVRIFVRTVGRWVGCDWPTRFGQLGLNLNGLKASHARLLAQATAGREAADWLAAARWLEQVEADARRAAEAAEIAADLALFGQLEQALASAGAACAIEAQYSHHEPVWQPLCDVIAAAWAEQTREASDPPAPGLRTLLVDDTPEMLHVLERLLAVRRPDIHVAGRASSGPEALEQAARLKPDLVLMDVEMPGMSGLEAGRRLTAEAAAPWLILMSGNGDAAYEEEAEKAGAYGFIYKPEFMSQLPLLLDLLFPAPGTSDRRRPVPPASLDLAPAITEPVA
jgi:CheY-like chemotaxis protein